MREKIRYEEGWGIGFRENGESIGCRVYEEYRECMRYRDHEDYKILRVKSRDIKILRM